mmetsp:Transcript_440/g.1505  ORF Transcript_440/g.1505 Transcript_440/m.1505 type:complete len:249 (-) Transcript_440:802-1548(-)
MVVVGAAQCEVRQQVDRDLAVLLGIVDGLALRLCLGVCMIGLVVLHRDAVPPPLGDVRLECGNSKARQDAILKCRPNVANSPQLVVHPAGFHRGLVRINGVLASLQGGCDDIGRNDAALNGSVCPLDLGHVQKSGRAAQQCTSWERQLGNALQAALVQAARSVLEHLTTLKCGPHRRVRLPALKFLVRREVRVLVVQSDNKASSDFVVLHVVQERPAICLVVERPADGMYSVPWPVLRRVDLPDFLDA